MPIYEFQCKKCGHRFERMQKMSDPHPTDCPECKAKKSVEQLMSAPAVQFKGSGWYVTDYAKKSGTSSSTSGEKKTDVKAETGSSEKSEKKTETKSSESKDSKKS